MGICKHFTIQVFKYHPFDARGDVESSYIIHLIKRNLTLNDYYLKVKLVCKFSTFERSETSELALRDSLNKLIAMHLSPLKLSEDSQRKSKLTLFLHLLSKYCSILHFITTIQPQALIQTITSQSDTTCAWRKQPQLIQ